MAVQSNNPAEQRSAVGVAGAGMHNLQTPTPWTGQCSYRITYLS